MQPSADTGSHFGGEGGGVPELTLWSERGSGERKDHRGEVRGGVPPAKKGVRGTSRDILEI